MVRVGNVDIEYHVDYLGRAIHILDKHKHSNQTLTNCIDPDWQRELIYKEQLLRDVYDFEWFCYGTDGIICSYRNWNFNFISDFTRLHQPFVEVLKARRQGIQ